MALGSFNATIVNSSGDIVPGAEIEVRRTSDNALATLFSDASRTAMTNPFNAHAVTAFAQFFADRDTYAVAASTGAGTVTWTVDVTPSSDGATYAPTRAEAILLNVPADQDILFVRSDAGLLAYKRDAAGTALTTADGQNWSPSSDKVTPQHFGVEAGTEALAVAGTLVDQTARLTAWMASPHPRLHVPAGWYRISESLYNKIDGRIITGDGRGYISNREHGFKGLVGAKSVFIVDKDDSLPRIRRTRRMAPETALDPDDASISVMLDNQGDGAQFSGFALVADVDLTNTSRTNMGADVDVGFFNGCRTAVKSDIATLGYFRVTSEYWDVTGSPVVGRMIGPDGLPYPTYKVSGCDQCFTNPQSYGGRSGVGILGAVWGTGTYYDFVNETTYGAWGSRGGSGHSDFMFGDQWVIYGPEHHSGFRLYDPTMNVSTEDTDAIPATIKIDTRRGSDSQGRGRRVKIGNGRIRTNEAARIWLDRAAEVTLGNIHTEPSGGVWKDTSGTVIDITDYTNHSYGALALRPTSGTRDGAIDIVAFDFQGTGVYARWTVEGVPTFSYADSFGDRQSGTWTPRFAFESFEAGGAYVVQDGTWHRDGSEVRVDFTLQWNLLNVTSDTSIAYVRDLPFDRANNSALLGQVIRPSSTGISGNMLLGSRDLTVTPADVNRVSFFTEAGGEIDYRDGFFLTTGTLRCAMTYHTDERLL